MVASIAIIDNTQHTGEYPQENNINFSKYRWMGLQKLLYGEAVRNKNISFRGEKG